LTRATLTALGVSLVLAAPAGAAKAPPCSGDRPYPGDGASRKALSSWLAGAAIERQLPPELPVIAALEETGLKNLPAGDSGSVGFFQMRVGVWENAYPGYESRPDLQLRWFLDRAKDVLRARNQAGLSSGPTEFGDWIADVERPEGQYRGRYQLRLAEARKLVHEACGGGL
jgi:hypothetical protein